MRIKTRLLSMSKYETHLQTTRNQNLTANTVDLKQTHYQILIKPYRTIDIRIKFILL